MIFRVKWLFPIGPPARFSERNNLLQTYPCGALVSRWVYNITNHLCVVLLKCTKIWIRNIRMSCYNSHQNHIVLEECFLKICGAHCIPNSHRDQYHHRSLTWTFCYMLAHDHETCTAVESNLWTPNTPFIHQWCSILHKAMNNIQSSALHVWINTAFVCVDTHVVLLIWCCLLLFTYNFYVCLLVDNVICTNFKYCKSCHV